ncbi:hypothetical protein IL972_00160 [Acinetobacter sp. FL51]|uniref:hypothetical protein n=1 Tax=Acinetobacter sp. FL51 TaxID=2777978 RepID=UPI0018E1335A|nr:hypothetical protein [Acinetobacter sp. FL51]MBI1450351.1 hypothetical protein [Acinetobacter sp. FL51]
MTAAIQTTLRAQLCHALIAAGKTDAKSIIGEVTALEQFISGETQAVETQAAKATTPVEVAQSTTETQTSAETAPAQVEENAVSFDDVKAALMQVAKKSRTELQEILNHFGAANLSAIQSKDFAEVVRMAEQALETADV